jgi:signal transduction histidine kinase
MQDLMLRTRDFAGTALRGVNYRLHCQDALLPVKLPLEFRQNIFLVFKETLTNIARHARATEVEAGIKESDGMWRIVIHDNGRGFDPATVTGGNGLKNLRARAMKMGAGLELTSRPGQGATLVFTVPRP